MACYRRGGCGPYEMLSCSECPASKPAYAQRYQPAPASAPGSGRDLNDLLRELADHIYLAYPGYHGSPMFLIIAKDDEEALGKARTALDLDDPVVEKISSRATSNPQLYTI